jgi:non-lysosomal glucosylceramidase
VRAVQVLSVQDGSKAEALRGWSWGMPGKTATYHGLFPRAWTVYEVKHAHAQRITHT